MRRVSVVGISGSGKTTFARALAARLGAEHLELDSVFHQPDWRPLPTEEFRARVGERVAEPRWVIDGNYGDHVQDLVWDAADTIVWLDLPRWRVMRAILPRSLRRVATRERLWNGNRERWRNLLDPRPEENVVLWAWTQHPVVRARYAGLFADPRWAGSTRVRLRSRAEARAFLEGRTPRAPDPA